MSPAPAAEDKRLVDRFGRHISYVRLSVTDRCDLRCRYCMAEKMRFLPRRDLLTFEELAELSDLLIARAFGGSGSRAASRWSGAGSRH